MYPNLRAEMARHKVTAAELAKAVGVTNGTMSQKMNGKFGFSLDEANTIKETLKTDLTIEELFEIKEL